MSEQKRSQAPLQMCYLGHPVLRQQAQPVESVTHEIKTLAVAMIETMRAFDGIGLAGNQIGRPIRIVALDIPMPHPEDQPFMSPGERVLLPRMPMVIINPLLSEFSEEKDEYTEGCLSIPDISAEVTRPDELRLRAQIVGGEAIDLPCGGLLARCLMHEQDHLDGILFIDHLKPAQLAPLRNRLQELENRTRQELEK